MAIKNLTVTNGAGLTGSCSITVIVQPQSNTCTCRSYNGWYLNSSGMKASNITYSKASAVAACNNWYRTCTFVSYLWCVPNCWACSEYARTANGCSTYGGWTEWSTTVCTAAANEVQCKTRDIYN